MGKKREKTMLTSFLISSLAPIATGIPAIISRSATQIADFLRRTSQLLALFVAWWVYRKIHGKNHIDNKHRARMERLANRTVFWAMIFSGVAMLIVGISRFFVYKVGGNPIMGLVVAILGLLVNAWFWFRYSSMLKEKFDSVIAGQYKLYRAKVIVDLAVVVALASVTILPNHPVTKYIDAIGCIIVALYLIYSGFDVIGGKEIIGY